MNTMADTAPPLIPDIIQEHLDHLGSLLESLRAELRSPERTLQDFAEVKESLEAHIDALVIAGQRIHPLLEAGLASEERAPASAAALALLHLGESGAAESVAEAFGGAEGERLDGLADALLHASIATILPRLQELMATAPPPVAVAAARVLAFHGKFDRAAERRWEELAHDESPEVRRAAWDVAALVDSREVRR
jgi:hypothetical protein